MDYNYLNLISMLPSGRYDVDRRRFKRNGSCVVLNYLCVAICFFCGLKYICIMALPFETNAILYLGELYIYDTPATLLFQFGSTVIHFTVAYVYVYWIYLSKEPARFECLRFLFISNFDDFCRSFNLEKEATKKFLRTATHFRYLIYLMMASFEAFFAVLICRCVAIAFMEIELQHFFFFTVPLTLITWFSYQCLIFSILIMKIFLFTTQAFLLLRFKTVAREIQELQHKKRNRKLRQRRIVRTINDIVRQFQASNILFDDLL